MSLLTGSCFSRFSCLTLRLCSGACGAFAFSRDPGSSFLGFALDCGQCRRSGSFALSLLTGSCFSRFSCLTLRLCSGACGCFAFSRDPGSSFLGFALDRGQRRRYGSLPLKLDSSRCFFAFSSGGGLGSEFGRCSLRLSPCSGFSRLTLSSHVGRQLSVQARNGLLCIKRPAFSGAGALSFSPDQGDQNDAHQHARDDHPKSIQVQFRKLLLFRLNRFARRGSQTRASMMPVA